MQDFTELDLKQLVVALLRKWWLIGLCALLIGGLSYFYTSHFITPMYRASVSIYVNNASSKAEDTGDYISGTNLATSQRLVKTYVNIIKSDTVLQKVVEQSGLDLTAEQIRAMMTANSVDDTEMFEIHVSSADPELAARVANAIADAAPDEIANILEGSSTKIVDYAKVPQYRYTPSFRRNTFLGCCVGGALAVVYVVLRTLLDKRIKSEDDLERLFDLPVLGIIPAFDSDHKKSSKYDYGYAGQAEKGGDGA